MINVSRKLAHIRGVWCLGKDFFDDVFRETFQSLDQAQNISGMDQPNIDDCILVNMSL